MARIVLFMSTDKALALFSCLQIALPKIHEDVVESNYDVDAVELYAHLNSIYDDLFIQLANKGDK